MENELLANGTLVAGRYRIEKALGVGGMGAVYLASDVVLGDEKVAIKILHRNFVNDEAQRARFLREVQLMRKVNHKNVVRTYDVGAEGNTFYFTMEYVPGVPLEQIITQGPLSNELIANYALQLAEALDAIHSVGVIHRDLKPANVLVLSDGTLRLTDFGVARPEVSSLTEHDEILGSVCYIAPEIWLGQLITPASDLYSLGIILYELATKKLPFDGESPAVLMRAHLDRAPIPPNRHNPNLSGWLNKLILRLLAKRPSDRGLSAKELVEHIRLHTGGAPALAGVEQDFIRQLEVKSKHLTASIENKKSSLATLSAELEQDTQASPTLLSFFQNCFLTLLLLSGLYLSLFLCRGFLPKPQLDPKLLYSHKSFFEELAVLLLGALELLFPLLALGLLIRSWRLVLKLYLFNLSALFFLSSLLSLYLFYPLAEFFSLRAVLHTLFTAVDFLSPLFLFSPQTYLYSQVLGADGIVYQQRILSLGFAANYLLLFFALPYLFLLSRILLPYCSLGTESSFRVRYAPLLLLLSLLVLQSFFVPLRELPVEPIEPYPLQGLLGSSPALYFSVFNWIALFVCFFRARRAPRQA